MASEPVLLTPDRVAEAGRVVAAAFADDPLTAFLYGGLSSRRGYQWGSAAGVRTSVALGDAYTTPGATVQGLATFCPPGRYPRSVWVQAWHFRAAPLRVPLRTILRALRASSVVGRVHPKEPHWYLETLAVHPDRQRQGVGSFLIAPTLERADQDGLPVYLETTKLANLDYYRRFGFEVQQELLVAGELRVWTMLRPPRP